MHGQGLITEVFNYLSREGDAVTTAVAELQLWNGQCMTLQCGGSSDRSRPAAGLFEVLVDHDPPRFWQRYSDADGLVYGNVPHLLIRHHITRHGCIREHTLHTDRPTKVVMDLHIEVELGLEMQVMEALRANGANVTKSRLIRL